MKRAAVIIGPTPSFVRWAIRQDCAFRQIDSDDLPQQTFQQLRGLREVSLGYLARQVVDGFCIHPELNGDAETARGFPVDEILKFFGDQEFIQSTCGNCPANAVRRFVSEKNRGTGPGSGVWAGCYGWLAAENESHDLIDAFEKSISFEQRNELLAGFENANRVWYRLWQTTSWNANQLTKLGQVIHHVASNRDWAACLPDLTNLKLAVEACLKNELVLETELVPQGHSDGVQWRMESHCSRCRCGMAVDAGKCVECGHRARPVDSIKRKVLGLRPFMLLKDVIGRQATESLLVKFEEMKTHQ